MKYVWRGLLIGIALIVLWLIVDAIVWATSVQAQTWIENNGKREWHGAGRTRVMVSHDLEIVSWPGLPDSTYFKVGIGLPTDSIWYSGDTTNIRLSDYYDIRFFNTADNRLEWEAILYQKPGNQYSWAFPFESNNLNFYYQPELTQEEIDNGDIRPDSVVGSYAVYHSSKKNNEYTTGKALHIYRPKAWDSAGDTVWIDLDIDTAVGELTIAGTRNWFRDAVYPVIIDPTFGADSIGESSGTISADFKLTGEFTLSEDGDVDSLARYTNTSSGTAATKGIIYDDGGAAPDALQGTSGEETVTDQPGWWIFSFSPSISLTGSANYYIGNISGGAIAHYYDAGGTNGFVDNADEYDDGPTDPFGSPNNANRILSVYAFYTATGAAVTTNRRQIIIRSE